MHLLSVNVGRPRLVMYNGTSVSTAIFKEPVKGRVMLRRLNLDGDRQANLQVHGGEHKAAYAYPWEHYAFWARELERDDLTPGQFGENFTVDGMLEEDVCIGDRYRIGETLVEVTQPRVPCRNLAIRMKDPGFPKRFLKRGRSGFYLRAIEEGEVGALDEIVLERRGNGNWTVHRIHTLMFSNAPDEDVILDAASSPGLSGEWRSQLLERIGARERG